MSKEAKIGLLLGLVFIVAIAVVLRGVHQNSTSDLGEQLAVNGDIENPNGEQNIEALDIPTATQQLTDTWDSAPVEDNQTTKVVDDPVEEATGPEEETVPERGGSELQWPQNRTRYIGNLFGGGQPTSGEATIARIGEQVNSIAGRSYVVQDGDSLWKIAQKELGRGERYLEIQRLNNLPDNYTLRIGQELKLPGAQSVPASVPERDITTTAAASGDMYEVREGDSLWGIAERELGAGGRYLELANMNNLTENSVLRVGQKLQLPGRNSVRTTNSVISTGAGERIYVVKKDESLWGIASRELGDPMRLAEIKRLNNLTSDLVLEGQKLRLPAK